jgi:hypothetical protein
MTDNTADQMKILIPMVRKVLPGLVARDLVGVQPMTWPGAELETGETYVDEAASYATEANTVEWYWVRLPMSAGSFWDVKGTHEHVNEVDAWCWETFGPRCSNEHPALIWDKINGRYCFKHSEDRTAFVLKWG